MAVRPNLFLVGAPKCGTTSLYEYLRQHPQIFFPAPSAGAGYWRAKEPAFFCTDLDLPPDNSIKDEQAYLASYAGSEGYRWRGDASAYYLYSEIAPARIREYSPDARILIVLRPPLDQMRSQYNHLVRSRREDIPDFHAAVSASSERRAGRRILPGRGVRAWLDYLGIAHFAPQVERYLETFGKDRVKVLLLEDLRARPAEIYRDVLAFLEVDTSFVPQFRVHNEAPPHGVLERLVTNIYRQPAVKRAAGALFPYEMRRRFVSRVRKLDTRGDRSDPRDLELRVALRPEVQRLAGLIGRDLSHWM
jgi:hypothetical protein